MADPAKKVFGAAADGTGEGPTSTGITPQDPAWRAAAIEAENEWWKQSAPTDPTTDYEAWAQQVKPAMISVASDLYRDLDIDPATSQGYLSTLDSMLDQILKNPKDLFVYLIQSNFRQSAFDMAINASRGALGWGRDVAYVYQYGMPPPPEVTPAQQAAADQADADTMAGEDQAGTSYADLPDGMTEMEKIYITRNGSLDGFLEANPSLVEAGGGLSPAALRWGGLEAQPEDTDEQEPVGPSMSEVAAEAAAAGDKGEAWENVVRQLISAEDAISNMSYALETFALLPGTIDVLNAFSTYLFTEVGVGIGLLPENTGTESAGVDVVIGQLRFLIDSGFFSGEALEAFRGMVEEMGHEL